MSCVVVIHCSRANWTSLYKSPFICRTKRALFARIVRSFSVPWSAQGVAVVVVSSRWKVNPSTSLPMSLRGWLEKLPRRYMTSTNHLAWVLNREIDIRLETYRMVVKRTRYLCIGNASHPDGNCTWLLVKDACNRSVTIHLLRTLLWSSFSTR